MIAADEDRIRHDKFVADFDAALVHDSFDRADQMLVSAHASGDAVHDNSDGFHIGFEGSAFSNLLSASWIDILKLV